MSTKEEIKHRIMDRLKEAEEGLELAEKLIKTLDKVGRATISDYANLEEKRKDISILKEDISKL